MKKYILMLLNTAILLVAVNTISASTITQTHNFNFFGGPYNDSGNDPAVVATGDFVATVSPFDTALGTLNAFTVEWDFNGQATFNILSGPGGGSAVISNGGSFFINGIGYGGGGGGNSKGGSGGTTDLELAFSVNESDTFDPTTVDPDILQAVTGTTDFDLLWGTGLGTSYTNVDSLNILATGSVKLTYDYTANAVPEPGTMLLLGFGLMGMGYVGRRQPKV